MFFIGIFGIEPKEEEVKDINNIICKKCGRISSYKLIKQYNVFHFFFIPIYKWNKKYYLISRCCETIFEISTEYGQRLEKEDDIVINDYELHEITFNYWYKKCPNCLREVDVSYNYCPYCGEKIN
ncbi:zinc-ribbon family protein [Caloramator fervidus]|uniref:Zinc-ribbon family protein n=1 Tax=Caloramator fervidus TaxID=29344 RepID=A0A1H5RNC2_9CLOT|nr:zinc ribbon domain-containing protein [Caloramator fervidus]SEF39839.1 zinc-ribbon family protein [Caloramator fervidus]